MAGQLTISTLSDGVNSTSATNPIRGSAKAWVQFSYTGTIAGSFNVSSITVTGTGTYSINMTTAMPNTNYAVIGSCSATTPASSSNAPCISTAPNTTSVCSACTFQSQAVGNSTQLIYNFVAVFSS